MDQISGLSASASGMRDAQVRLNVASHSVANVNTDGFIPGTVNSLAQEGGGVLPVVTPYQTAGVQPLHSAQTIGLGNPSQTDLTTEFVNTIAAKAAFEANAKMVSVQADSSFLDDLRPLE